MKFIAAIVIAWQRRFLASVLMLGCTVALAQESVPVPPPAPADPAAPADLPAPPASAVLEVAPMPPAEVAAAPAPAKVWERCGVVYSPALGSVSSKVVASMHVADLADGEEFVMPKDAPDGVLAVQCARDSVLPQRNDYKVLIAGFPFTILTKDRASVLEMKFGSLGLRTLKGEFTKEEQPLVQAYLDEAQYAIDKYYADKAAAAKKKKKG